MAIILKNNAPHYVFLDYGLFRQDNESVDAVVSRIFGKRIKAFEELAE
jgi:hypothetical protein